MIIIPIFNYVWLCNRVDMSVKISQLSYGVCGVNTPQLDVASSVSVVN